MLTPRRAFLSSLFLSLVALEAACAPRSDVVRWAPVESPRPAVTNVQAARLAWMEGRWGGNVDGTDMEEQWSSPAGSALIGMHKDVKLGKMTSFEFLRIEATPQEGLVYYASPRSAPVTPFYLLELGDRRVVFENKAHDFPQRILYWLDAAGGLHARIEGTLKGSIEAEEWAWTKR